LDRDENLCLALTRVVEIIGEAGDAGFAAVSTTSWARYPGPRSLGLRNRLVHGYDAVDVDILWDIVQQDLPPLIERLEAIVQEEI